MCKFFITEQGVAINMSKIISMSPFRDGYFLVSFCGSDIEVYVSKEDFLKIIAINC